MAKKIRRRRTSKKPEAIEKPKQVRKKKKKVIKKPSTPTIEEREQQAEKLKDVTVNIYNDVTFDRLDALPDFRKKQSGERMSVSLGVLINATNDKIAALTKDKNLTLAETLNLKAVQRAADNTNPSVAQRTYAYIFDRTEGKPKERIEHTGANGQPLEAVYRQVIDPLSMTREQALEYKKMLQTAKDFPTKEVPADESED